MLAPGRVDGAIHHPRNLGATHVVIEGQLEGRPLRQRQRVQGAFEGLVQAAQFEAPLRLPALLALGRVGHMVERFIVLVQGHAGFAIGDGENPDRDLAAAIEAAGFLPDHRRHVVDDRQRAERCASCSAGSASGVGNRRGTRARRHACPHGHAPDRRGLMFAPRDRVYLTTFFFLVRSAPGKPLRNNPQCPVWAERQG